MKIHFGLLSAVSILGLIAAAHAQTASPAPVAPGFDGTYRVVSSTPTSKMYTAYNGQMGICPNRRPSQLHILHGQAHYTTATGYRLGGTVGPQGELTMRSEMVGGARPARLQAPGTIDANGTVDIHQRGSSCSYDLVWKK